MSRRPASTSRKMFAAMIASPFTMPKYRTMRRPSKLGVVVRLTPLPCSGLVIRGTIPALRRPRSRRSSAGIVGAAQVRREVREMPDAVLAVHALQLDRERLRAQRHRVAVAHLHAHPAEARAQQAHDLTLHRAPAAVLV